MEESFTEEDSSVRCCCGLALDQTQSEISERNTEKVENIALAAMPYSVGLRAAAAILTAAWIDARVITQISTNRAIDHNKIKRAQEKLMKSASEEFSKFVSLPKSIAFFFDGRTDMTKIVLCKEGSVKCYPATIKKSTIPYPPNVGENIFFILL